MRRASCTRISRQGTNTRQSGSRYSFLSLLFLLFADTISADSPKPILGPKGSTVLRDVAWVFACPGAGEYSIEVRTDQGVVAKSATRLVRFRDGACEYVPTWSDSFKISHGYLDVGKTYQWRAVAKSGPGSWTDFSIMPVVDFRFEALPLGLVLKGEGWKVTDGWLENREREADAIAVSSISFKSLPGDEATNQRGLQNGNDVTFVLEAGCPEAQCEIGLLFGGSRRDCNPLLGCGQDSSYRLVVPQDASPFIERITSNFGVTPKSVRIIELPNAYIDLSYPTTVRIVQTRELLALFVGGEQIACFNHPPIETSWQSLNAGVTWKSWEDDQGKNYLRVDRIIVVGPPSVPNCAFPFPKI